MAQDLHECIKFQCPKQQDLAHSELVTELTVIGLTKHFAIDIFLEEVLYWLYLCMHVSVWVWAMCMLLKAGRGLHIPGAAVAKDHEWPECRKLNYGSWEELQWLTPVPSCQPLPASFFSYTILYKVLHVMIHIMILHG